MEALLGAQYFASIAGANVNGFFKISGSCFM